MRWATLAFLIFSAAVAAADTHVTLTGATEGAEVCRFQARDREKPVERWLSGQAVTCVAADTELTFPSGLWNVFARAKGMVSVDPTLVDSNRAPANLELSLVPAATVVLQLPPDAKGVLYSPKHAIAFAATERTTVPAGEELWLIVIVKSVPVAVVPIASLEAGIERVVDARVINDAPSVLGWIHVSEADRAAIKTARGVQLPRIALSATGKEVVAASLPVHDALNGAFVLFRGLSAGNADLRLDGRGWLPFRRSLRIAPRPLSLLREPIPARATTTIIVNWSTSGDLVALERSLGSCETPKEAPRFELTIAACPEPKPGKSLDPASCSVIHKETLRTDSTFGSVRVDEVPPGTYRAELRYGRLPPFDVIEDIPPLQQRPMAPLQAKYFEVYGSLTRGGEPLHDDARIEFPMDGVGFARRDSGEYHGVVKSGFEEDSKIDIVTCSGKRAYVITDREMALRSRFDIDIPDNTLTVTVVDTFTLRPLPTATLKYVVMSLRGRFPLLTREVSQSDEGDEPGKHVAGQFVIKGLPERKLFLTVSCPGYKKKEIEPFSMTKSEKKNIDVDLVPLGGSEAKVISSRPFVNGMIFWFNSSGVEMERAELAPDGTFHFEQTHYRDETMTVVSASHPLWILRAPPVEKATPLQVKFPDSAAQRDAEVTIYNMRGQMVIPIGVTIGGWRVPQPALVQHLALRGTSTLVKGGGPLLVPGLAESGPIDILRGPAGVQRLPQSGMQRIPLPPAMDPLLRTFVPVETKRLEPGSTAVAFDATAK
ncbi:MAG TPA: hypothetical protein VHX14_16290 [Thermoanaerobaculia bacterium]|jgi:hypothetical protein|nr:hypothetical protein [Thermoanaerobaculia bacterium]